MKIKVHFTIGEYGEYDDEIIFEGKSIEELKPIILREMERRGLDQSKNNLWSEVIE